MKKRAYQRTELEQKIIDQKTLAKSMTQEQANQYYKKKQEEKRKKYNVANKKQIEAILASQGIIL